MSNFKKCIKEIFGDKQINRLDLMEKLWNFKESEIYKTVGDHQSKINDLDEEVFHLKNELRHEKEKLTEEIKLLQSNNNTQAKMIRGYKRRLGDPVDAPSTGDSSVK